VHVDRKIDGVVFGERATTRKQHRHTGSQCAFHGFSRSLGRDRYGERSTIRSYGTYQEPNQAAHRSLLSLKEKARGPFAARAS
jgi:hypothetical protein